jgi:hypothetical protein
MEFEQFHLNLNFHDERVCMSTLLAISTREDPGYIRNPMQLWMERCHWMPEFANDV